MTEKLNNFETHSYQSSTYVSSLASSFMSFLNKLLDHLVFSTSACFVLFEVTLLLMLLSIVSQLVFL